MHNAKAGGEFGANGEFYKGGQFVADLEDTVKEHRYVDQSFDARMERAINYANRDLIYAQAFVAQYEREKLWAGLSQYVGSVGDKIEVSCEITDIFGFEDAFGWTTVAKFADDDGNVIVWFASSFKYDFEKGDRVIIRGTVKDHGERNSAKQTVVTRCKLIAA